jgi:hypothetical protein
VQRECTIQDRIPESVSGEVDLAEDVGGIDDPGDETYRQWQLIAGIA